MSDISCSFYSFQKCCKVFHIYTCFVILQNSKYFTRSFSKSNLKRRELVRKGRTFKFFSERASEKRQNAQLLINTKALCSFRSLSNNCMQSLLNGGNTQRFFKIYYLYYIICDQYNWFIYISQFCDWLLAVHSTSHRPLKGIIPFS